MKKMPGDIIILHFMYSSWERECDGQNFLSFWIVFQPFANLTTEKIKILKKKGKKTPGDIILLHICTTNENHIMYVSSDMERDGQKFLSFWTFLLPFYPLNNPKNQNFAKMKKLPGDIIILYKSTKIMIICCTDPKIRCVTDVILFSFKSTFCPFTPLTTDKMKI